EAVTVDVAGSGARSHHAAAADSRAARAETAAEARATGPTGADAAAQARGAHGTGRTDCVGAAHRAGVHHAAACTGRARGTCGAAAASAHHHRRHHAALVALALAALRVRVDGGLAELTVVEAVVAVRRHAGHRTLGGTALHLGPGILGISHHRSFVLTIAVRVAIRNRGSSLRSLSPCLSSSPGTCLA